jgi:Holliday junction resolvase-like predicted endonuclease
MVNISSDLTGRKPTDPNRIGDVAEYYAVTWLWDSGYQVFKNCGCTGEIDLIAISPDGELKLIDVKSYKDGRLSARSARQKSMGVVYVHFNSVTRKCRFVEHRE